MPTKDTPGSRADANRPTSSRPTARRFDLIVREALIFDGSGSPGFRADVGIVGGFIEEIGDLTRMQAVEAIDAAGLFLSPGFIDVHSHSDRTVIVDRRAESSIRQGVTTLVIGNCGIAAAPLTPEMVPEEESRWHSWLPGFQPAWRSFSEYLGVLSEGGLGVNVAALAAHGAIRRASMGYAMRLANRTELISMQRLLDAALDAGAFGLSSGLTYLPGASSDLAELVELTRSVAACGGVYATHIRDEGSGLVGAVMEAIDVAGSSGVSLQISHHKALGPRSWGRVYSTLRLIDEANTGGLQIDFDQYPYTASNTSLGVILPRWAHEGGPLALAQRIREEATRPRIAAEAGQVWAERNPGLGWDSVMIAASPASPTAEGRTVADLAAASGQDPIEIILNLLERGEGRVSAVFFNMAEGDVRAVMLHPRMMVGSDSASLAVDGPLRSGCPHPRAYGTFARILGRYVRSTQLLRWEEAIYRMTGAPAAKFRLHGRGTIAAGAHADVVLFDPETIIDSASFTDPHQYAKGIAHVIVNGELVVRNGQHTGQLAGRLLTRA